MTIVLLHKLFANAIMALIICPAVRLYWFIRPQRRHGPEKLIRFVDVTTLMAITLLLGYGGNLGGFAFLVALGILGLMVLSERKRATARAV